MTKSLTIPFTLFGVTLNDLPGIPSHQQRTLDPDMALVPFRTHDRHWWLVRSLYMPKAHAPKGLHDYYDNPTKQTPPTDWRWPGPFKSRAQALAYLVAYELTR